MKDKLDNLDPLIIKWIFDRRDSESNNLERDIKANKQEYEDTRTTHNNDKSWFD